VRPNLYFYLGQHHSFAHTGGQKLEALSMQNGEPLRLRSLTRIVITNIIKFYKVGFKEKKKLKNFIKNIYTGG
jgi:hypothetical protein